MTLPERFKVVNLTDYITIFLTSLAVLLYQIVLTRLLSVVTWFHFVFLVLSLVMLGLGVPGVIFTLIKRRKHIQEYLLLFAGLSIPLSTYILINFGVYLVDQSIFYLILIILPSMLALGGVICLLLIQAEDSQISIMYGIDLLGAALGALIIIPLMNTIPTPLICASIGLLPLFGLFLKKGFWRYFSTILIIMTLGALSHSELFHLHNTKSYSEAGKIPIKERWTAIARIAVFDDLFFDEGKKQVGFNWGVGFRFPHATLKGVSQYWLDQDGFAGTPITFFDGDFNKLDFLLYDVTSIGYQTHQPNSVAIIGSGGGRDILTAIKTGAKEVHAIELNKKTVEVVNEVYGGNSDNPYKDPRVSTIVSDGRSYLTHTKKKFDFIQISLVDSHAASSAGAFTLVENNLYTKEALSLYLKKLKPQGLVSISCWGTLNRLVSMAFDSLTSIGIATADAHKHIAVITAEEISTLLISNNGLSTNFLKKLRSVSLERGFRVTYASDWGSSKVLNILEEKKAHKKSSDLTLKSPSDDSPYFYFSDSPFQLVTKEKSEPIFILQTTIITVSIISLGLFFFPFIFRSNKAHKKEDKNFLKGSLFFAAIGSAFMLIENMLIQKLVLYLGHPTYSTTIVVTGLLLGMGIGSLLSPKVGLLKLQKFGYLVGLLLCLLTITLPYLISTTLGLNWNLRVIISLLILLPLGGMFGLFFPIGMSHFPEKHKPWFWAINGFFGVVASVFSLALSMEFGFTMVGFLGVFGYLVAWFCLKTPPLKARGM